MWSSVCVFGRHPTLTARQLERCRGFPLHLSIDIPCTAFQVEEEESTSPITREARMIRAQQEQVRSISATVGDCRAFHRLFGSDWPNLEELIWIDVCPSWLRIHEEVPTAPWGVHQTPKLRYLSAQQGIAWWLASTTSLTALKLEGPMDTDLLGFLRANPRLKSLELVDLDLQPSLANTTSFDLPDVTRVVMYDVEYAHLFLCVTFPSLRHLVVDPLRCLGLRKIAWGQLQFPPTLTALEIQYLTHPFQDRISITGSDEANDSSLSLTESAGSLSSTPMIQALSNALLSRVTSLSIGGGAVGFWSLLPSTLICTLVSGLPHLWYLSVLSHHLTLTIVDHLCNHLLDCPELRILSLTLVRSTCSMSSRSLSGFLSDRASSGRWVHRVDCVILEAPGEDLEEAKRVWEFLSRDWGFAGCLRCNCVGEVRKAGVRLCS